MNAVDKSSAMDPPPLQLLVDKVAENFVALFYKQLTCRHSLGFFSKVFGFGDFVN